MKNQGENKNRHNRFDSLGFIHFYLIKQHFMKFWKDKVLKNLGKLI